MPSVEQALKDKEITIFCNLKKHTRCDGWIWHAGRPWLPVCTCKCHEGVAPKDRIPHAKTRRN